LFQTLLALIELTKGNPNIQKIVAFESGFESIFAIIQQEGLSDGGVVVEDCLLLLLHLLKNNTSNQQFFKVKKEPDTSLRIMLLFFNFLLQVVRFDAYNAGS